MSIVSDPLSGGPPIEVPLPTAPLVRVLAQVRYPVIASIQSADFVASFQEAIRSDYCILEPEHARVIEFSPEGAVEGPPATTWRFHDSSRKWRVSLAPDFLAVETTAYVSRLDFLSRLTRVANALQAHVDPKVIQRLGVRYIDRLPGVTGSADMHGLVRPEVIGIIGSPIGARVIHSMADNLFRLDGESRRLRARWGVIPPNSTIDPTAIEPIDDASWILDIDASVELEQPFDVDALAQQAQRLSEHIYAFFRWTVTDAFLKKFGAHL